MDGPRQGEGAVVFTGLKRVSQGRAGQGGPGLARAGLARAGQGRAGQGWAAWNLTDIVL